MSVHDDKSTGSSETISEQAYREVEGLNDPKYVGMLAYYVDFVEEEEGNRRNAYFILTRLAMTSKYPRDAFLALYHANSCREEIDACLADALGQGQWLALVAIREDSSPDLIEPLLKALSTASAGPLVGSLVQNLAMLAKESHIDTYIDILQNQRSADAKSAAVRCIRKYGDSRAIDAVIKRVKSILARKRTREHWTFGSDINVELVDALIYLKKYEATDERIPKLFHWVAQKRNHLLQSEETEWVEANLATYQKPR